MATLMTKEQALELCATIVKNGQVLDDQIQSALTTACGYSLLHGDVTIGAKLIAVFPAGSKKSAAVEFLCQNGNFEQDEDKAMVFKVNGELTPIKSDVAAILERCNAVAWHKYAKKAPPKTEYDVCEDIAALLKKYNKASKKDGVTFVGLEYMPILREIAKGADIGIVNGDKADLKLAA